LSYDFASANDAAVSVEFALPAGEIEGVRLRMRQDDSWHAASAILEIGGRRYDTGGAPLYLGVDGWREWSFRLPDPRARDERFLGVWRLRDAGASDVAAGRARLTFRVDQLDVVRATLARWTQSY